MGEIAWEIAWEIAHLRHISPMFATTSSVDTTLKTSDVTTAASEARHGSVSAPSPRAQHRAPKMAAHRPLPGELCTTRLGEEDETLLLGVPLPFLDGLGGLFSNSSACAVGGGGVRVLRSREVDCGR